MTPINVAFLWHQHQPFYYSREQGAFLLPWVRLHATKDYLEMAQHLEAHPAMHATVNFVPSLIQQIQYYEDGIADTLLAASRKRTDELTDDERHQIIRDAFHADRNRMIGRSERYRELAEKRDNGGQWSDEDLRDLIVHYHLAWTGEFERSKELLTELIAQDRNFTEEQKDLLFQSQDLILRKIVPLHQRLAESGQIELSASPMYHPILPLLCDIASAREVLPNCALPHRAIGNRMSADRHVEQATAFHEQTFGSRPRGMWPSEGSVSNAALDIMMQNDIRWTASDEAVLYNSINHRVNADLPRRYDIYEKYFPRRVENDGRQIVIFFRDHSLSDKIGFDYQKMSADVAVADFIGNIERIRHDILHHYGNEALSHACISVILDGENCWEYYENNGYEFLDKLYTALTSNERIRTVTFSEYLERVPAEQIAPLHHIVPGSWIHGDFRIWVGHAEKNRAWDLLAEIWNLGIDDLGPDDPLRCAEGSDWFWWYGDDHVSKQKHLFDELFREHLRAAYVARDLAIPAHLYESLLDRNSAEGRQYGAMHRAGA